MAALCGHLLFERFDRTCVHPRDPGPPEAQNGERERGPRGYPRAGGGGHADGTGKCKENAGYTGHAPHGSALTGHAVTKRTKILEQNHVLTRRSLHTEQKTITATTTKTNGSSYMVISHGHLTKGGATRRSLLGARRGALAGRPRQRASAAHDHILLDSISML